MDIGLVAVVVVFCVFMDRDEVEVNKNAKNKRPISSRPCQTILVNKGLRGQKQNFFLRDHLGKSRDCALW